MRDRRRDAMHVISNVFFGIALGLAAYYSLTSGIGWLEQRELDDAAAPLGAVGTPSPDDYLRPPSRQDPVLDFEGWEDEDRAYWESLENGGVFGRIIIEDIDVDAIVVKGTTRSALQKGPGWIEWTSLPGPEGTCGIAGHRTTYLAPFRRIDELSDGDIIEFYSPYRLYRYEVEESVSVTPDRSDVLDAVDYPRLGLSACHPPYSARYRLVVLARLIEVRRFTETPDSL
ncbi:MAG: class E sortase [Coriobacteriia bacterium]|nr:class E sortase [Coriobacteriia bacterium]MBN2822916.1 class E sortase [Coriobacteriia bacterium]